MSVRRPAGVERADEVCLVRLMGMRASMAAWVSITCGLAIAAICAQVAIGWFLQDLRIVRIRPTWPD